MAGADAGLASAAGDVEEAAPLVAGPGSRRAPASVTGAPRDVHLLSSAFLFVFLAYHAAQNLQSTVNTVGAPAARYCCSTSTSYQGCVPHLIRGLGGRAVAGREPGLHLAGRALHVLHGVLGGGLRGRAVDGIQARARGRHLRLPPLYRSEPPTVLVSTLARSSRPPSSLFLKV